MLFRNFLLLFLSIILSNCTTETLIKKKSLPETVNNIFLNKGFTLVYNENLYEKKIVSKKINDRTMIMFQKNLEINTKVKITNLLNNKSILATVGKKSIYPIFNNSVVSRRIADELDLDFNEPYVELLEIHENTMFMAKKAKTYDEEKQVALTAPVNNISINVLNAVEKKKEKPKNINFSYLIKVADFYFNDTALLMINRIGKNNKDSKPKIKKISNTKYRVYLGPFNNINSLQKSFNDISIIEFENIEIIKND